MKHAEREREREREKISLESNHRYHSARARCLRQGNILYIDYSGSISHQTMQALDMAVLVDRVGTESSIERLDSALTLFGAPRPFDPLLWPTWVPPSVVYVRPDQQPASIEFCALLARHGVLRQTFLAHQTDLAQIWLDGASQIVKSRSRRLS